MIFERTLKMAAAAAAIAVGVLISISCAAYALFVFLQEHVGTAGAAALVSALFLGFSALIALFATQKPPSSAPPAAGGETGFPPFDLAGLGEKIGDLVQGRPLVAAGVAVAIGLIALRNPDLVLTLARALLKPAPPQDRTSS
jgi:hypothetical protein